MPSWKHREHSIKIQTVLQDRGFPQGSWEFMKAGWGFPLNGGYFWSCCVVCTRPILSGCSAPKRSTPSPRVLLGRSLKQQTSPCCTQAASHRALPLPKPSSKASGTGPRASRFQWGQRLKIGLLKHPWLNWVSSWKEKKKKFPLGSSVSVQPTFSKVG